MRDRRLTRKEVAALVGTSTHSVRRNEIRWGLEKAKVRANGRVIWYHETVVMRELLARNLIAI